ncbi:hypothetical protein PENTCL1PPCAC_9719, partial [Pristionchus entomophagus]
IMRTILLLFSTLLPACLGCIRMVPTDPGIPATQAPVTPAPKMCPALMHETTFCDGDTGKTCFPVPSLAGPTISCGTGNVLYITQPTDTAMGVDKLVCNPATGVWEGMGVNPGNGAVEEVACYPA